MDVTVAEGGDVTKYRGMVYGRALSRRRSSGGLTLTIRALLIAVMTLLYMIPAGIAAGVLVVFGDRQVAKQHLSRRLVALLQRLGPTFIKGGQILGTRRDVIPPVLCDELSILQDATTPLSPEQARATLADVYGSTLNTTFAYVDYNPVASGSIACVYYGQLRDGRAVAIKLQRPTIRATMATDLALLNRTGKLLVRLSLFRGTPIRKIIDYLSEAVYAQLDFRQEAKNLRHLRENLSSVPRVWVPRLEAEASRDRAVVMEYIPDLHPAVARHCSEALRKQFANQALTAVYQMLFVDGFVHCDLHPGNLYFTERGQVVVLDAGFSVQLTDWMRRLFAEFFLNMARGRGRRCAEIVVESSTSRGPNSDVNGFIEEMAALVTRNSGLPAHAFSLIAFATEMFDLQRKHDLHAAPELVFPLLSLLVIEGTIRELDSEVDFQQVARPVLMRGLFGVQ